MRKIFIIAWKDTLLRFSSTSEWLFFLILPIVFTFILAGGTGAPSDPRILLDVVDQANSPLSAELVAALQKSDSIRPELKSLSQVEGEFNARQVSVYLVIPAQFTLGQLETGQINLELRQQPNNMDALIATRAVQTAASRISSAVEIARSSVSAAENMRAFASLADQQAYFEAALQAAQTEMSAAPNRLAVQKGATTEQVDYDPRANSSAGQLITWVFVPLIAISSLFASEREEGTLRRLLTTPTRRATYLLGTIAGQVGMALVQMLLLVGFGILVMRVNWGRDPGALAVMLVTSALAGGALGVALGAFVKTSGQASGLSIMLGMVMALLGGCWYPIELFPSFVQNAVKILPTRWAMQGMLELILRGQGMAAILPDAGVLLGFAALFFVIGVWRFRYE